MPILIHMITVYEARWFINQQKSLLLLYCNFISSPYRKISPPSSAPTLRVRKGEFIRDGLRLLTVYWVGYEYLVWVQADVRKNEK